MTSHVIIAAATMTVLLIVETIWPFFGHFRGRLSGKVRHDGRNLALGLLNAAMVAIGFGGLITAAVAWSEENGVGLLRQVDLPPAVEAAIAFLLFDLFMYGWHRLFHEVPLLWRLHRVHHADTEMDATTGLRFHTGEVALATTVRLGVLTAIGMTLWQFTIYESVFLLVVYTHHSDLWLPAWLESLLSPVIVTPRMHRVHHSRWRPETNSNYGSVFSWWDRLFWSYRWRADPREIRLGLDGLDDDGHQTVTGMLKTPLE